MEMMLVVMLLWLKIIILVKLVLMGRLLEKGSRDDPILMILEMLLQLMLVTLLVMLGSWFNLVCWE